MREYDNYSMYYDIDVYRVYNSIENYTHIYDLKTNKINLKIYNDTITGHFDIEYLDRLNSIFIKDNYYKELLNSDIIISPIF